MKKRARKHPKEKNRKLQKKKKKKKDLSDGRCHDHNDFL